MYERDGEDMEEEQEESNKAEELDEGGRSRWSWLSPRNPKPGVSWCPIGCTIHAHTSVLVQRRDPRRNPRQAQHSHPITCCVSGSGDVDLIQIPLASSALRTHSVLSYLGTSTTFQMSSLVAVSDDT